MSGFDDRQAGVFGHIALGIEDEYRDFVGIYKDGSLCNTLHDKSKQCTLCRWNCCQEPVCDNPAMCLKCGAEDCIPTCVFVGKPFRFTGWRGVCKPHTGIVIPLDPPDKWKEAIGIAVPSVGGSVAGSTAIVISDDEEDDIPPSDKEEYKYWDHGASDNCQIDIFEGSIGNVQKKHLAEVFDVFKKLEIGIEKCKSYSPAPPSGFVKECIPIKINKIKRVQNRQESEMYYIKRKHFKTKYSGKGVDFEKVVFHGTKETAAKNLAENGAIMQYSDVSQYGKGFYVSSLLSIPVKYALDKAQPWSTPVLVCCEALTGVAGRTDFSHRQPGPGCDSGGCGTEWISVLFKESQIRVSYLIYFEQCSPAEFETLKDEIRDARKKFEDELATRAVGSVPIPGGVQLTGGDFIFVKRLRIIGPSANKPTGAPKNDSGGQSSVILPPKIGGASRELASKIGGAPKVLVFGERCLPTNYLCKLKYSGGSASGGSASTNASGGSASTNASGGSASMNASGGSASKDDSDESKDSDCSGDDSSDPDWLHPSAGKKRGRK